MADGDEKAPEAGASETMAADEEQVGGRPISLLFSDFSSPLTPLFMVTFVAHRSLDGQWRSGWQNRLQQAVAAGQQHGEQCMEENAMGNPMHACDDDDWVCLLRSLWKGNDLSFARS